MPLLGFVVLCAFSVAHLVAAEQWLTSHLGILWGLVAFAERTLIRERQREGIAAAKADGKYMGRKPVFDDAKTAKLLEYVKRGMTPMEISRQASIYNKLAELGIRKQATYTTPPEAPSRNISRK